MSINKMRIDQTTATENMAERAVKPSKVAPKKPEAKSPKQKVPDEAPVWPGGVDRFHEGT
jgi:hypothetical protein